MDSYFFGWYLGRPASPPLPDEYSGGYLPQMPAYSDASPSGRSSGVPQPIDFGGSVTGYSSDASQSRHTSVPPIEYGGATGSSASQPTSSERRRPFTDEEKSRMLSGLQQALDNGSTMRKYAAQIGISQGNLSNWRSEAQGSLKGNYRRFTDEEKSRAVREMLDRKCTPDEYSRETRIPISNLRRWIAQSESTWLAQDVGSSRSKHRRKYSDEEKSRAVREILDKGCTAEEYSREIGIPACNLRNWLKKYEGSSRDAR